MKNKKGNVIPFKRYVDKNATSRKWNEPLENHAYESDGAYVGSFISPNDGDDWYEVVDKRVDRDDRDSSKIDRIMYFLIPVDKFGNKLSIKQIEKKFSFYRTDLWKKNLENYGYATYRETRPDEEVNWLVAGTNMVNQYDRYGNVDWDNDTVRKLDIGENSQTFDDIDEWGRYTPVEEFLKENPDFDPEVDGIPPAYQKTSKYPSAGNAEVRANFKKIKAEYEARKAAADERNAKRREEHSGLYSPWGGYDEKKFFALQPDVKDSDKEKLLRNTKIFGDMPYNREDPDFKTTKDFKKWVDQIGGDWSVVRDAYNQSSDAMSSAMSNAAYYNN